MTHLLRAANIIDDTQPATIVDQLQPSISAFAAALPAGLSLATGGAVEESAKSQGPIADVVPVMLLVIQTLFVGALVAGLIYGLRGTVT